jgi:ATP-binding cassette subfamily B protein
MDAEKAATRISGLFGPLAGLVELLGGMIVLALGVIALAEGVLTLGGLLVFLTYLAQLYSPIRALGSLSNDIFAAAAGASGCSSCSTRFPRCARPIMRGRCPSGCAAMSS